MTDERYQATGGSPRVSLIGDDEAAAITESQRLTKWVADLNIFRALMHRPILVKQLNRIGGALMQGNVRAGERPALDERLRELAIMRIAWVTKSAYEWGQHWRIAQSLGVPASELEAVRDWRSHGGFGMEEGSVLAAVDETLAGDPISDQTWDKLASFLGEDELVELTVVIGHWLMVSTFLRSLRVPLEDDVDSWPPDGRSPD